MLKYRGANGGNVKTRDAHTTESSTLRHKTQHVQREHRFRDTLWRNHQPRHAHPTTTQQHNTTTRRPPPSITAGPLMKQFDFPRNGNCFSGRGGGGGGGAAERGSALVRRFCRAREGVHTSFFPSEKCKQTLP